MAQSTLTKAQVQALQAVILGYTVGERSDYLQENMAAVLNVTMDVLDGVRKYQSTPENVSGLERIPVDTDWYLSGAAEKINAFVTYLNQNHALSGVVAVPVGQDQYLTTHLEATVTALVNHVAKLTMV